jgi:hypothetical protein
MSIYYILLEGKPLPNNKESEECAGAFINCWVNSKDKATAKKKAIEYVYDQGWQVLNIEEISIVDRERYLDEPDSLECVDNAISCGIGANFYTWPVGSEEDG